MFKNNKILKIILMKPYWYDKEKECLLRCVVSIILALVSFVLMFADLSGGSMSMAYSSILLVAGFSMSAIMAGVFKKPVSSTIIIAIMAALVLSSYAVSGGNQGFAILWILVVPMFSINVLGLWVGLSLSTFFLLFLGILFHSPLSYIIDGKYTDAFLVRFPVLYFCVFVMATFICIQKEYYTKKSNLFLFEDDLTGVYSRQYFFKKAEEVLKNNPDVEYDIEISDIIDFKKINEIYGVAEADKILVWIADFLLKNMDERFLIGRYSGDQFVVMAPHYCIEEILKPRMFEGFINSMKAADIPACEMKFGLYENIPHDSSVISSCDKAHIALNSIKKHYGKIRAYYSDTIEDKIEIQRKIEQSMGDALEQNQFKVFYQPKHDAKTGKLVGAEALIRWIHPQYGFMSPGDFIPLFEQNGFIVETDFFVWERTCQNIKRWQSMGFEPIPISVNSSKLVLEQDDLLNRTQAVISEAGIAPNLLHIEVTETMMSDDIEGLIKKLNALREKGFVIELDDFGSGYSSMNILSSLPIDIVKLDMSFMKQFGNEKRMKVLTACVRLANDLGYKTVSEGVELKEQVDLLSKIGVDYIQGYYYSKPLSEEEFEKYMSVCNG